MNDCPCPSGQPTPHPAFPPPALVRVALVLHGYASRQECEDDLLLAAAYLRTAASVYATGTPEERRAARVMATVSRRLTVGVLGRLAADVAARLSGFPEDVGTDGRGPAEEEERHR